MKKFLYLIVVLISTSCTEQILVDEGANDSVEQTSISEVNALIEKARWGDGEAYVKLADCYRDGNGVKQDFIGMLSMASFADDFGGIKRMEDYISSLPAESEYKMVFDAMEKFSSKKCDEAIDIAEELIAKDCLEGYTVKGIITSEQGDKPEGKRLLRLAAEKGSSFAELYLCVPDWQQGKAPDIVKLKALSDKIPIANACLAKIYSGKENEAMKDDKLAAYYYLKADEKACLTKDGARWLLAYHRTGGELNLTEKDIERLETLANIRDHESVAVKYRDMVLEEGIIDILQGDKEDYMQWSKGMVYVVGTKTGRILANVSYERKGESYVPYVDTYNQEQSVMECGSTYLALLSSGIVTPEHVYDTGFGVYGEVRDHNWRRGGYGTISLERALGVRSQIAFTMAKE